MDDGVRYRSTTGASDRRQPRASSLALVAVTALAPIAWGTTYLVTSEWLPSGRPLLAGLLRALPAGIVLAAITRVRPSGWWWVKGAVLGVLNVGGFFALLFFTAYRLPGGVAATLGALQPLVAAGLAAVLLDEPLRRVTVVAGLLGLVGVALLVVQAEVRLDALGLASGFGGALSMATGVVLTKRWGRPVGLLAFTSWQLIAGGVVLIPLAFGIEGMPPPLSTANVLGFVWLGTVGTAIAYSLWFRGIQLLPTARVSLLGLLSPVVAALCGWIALDQTFSPGQVTGVVCVLAAVVLGQVTPSSKHAWSV